VIEVNGENLPVTDDVEVNFGRFPENVCAINSKTATKITCTMATKPTAGNWHVEVRDSEGRAKPNDGLAKISVPLVVASVSPNKDINFNGGTILTLTGTGFPDDIKKANVKLDDQTGCKVLTTSATKLTCKLWKFKSVNATKDFKVVVTVQKVIS